MDSKLIELLEKIEKCKKRLIALKESLKNAYVKNAPKDWDVRITMKYEGWGTQSSSF